MKKELYPFLSELLIARGIDCFAPIPLEACTVKKQYLLERENIFGGTAILIAVPYFTAACTNPKRNCSAYAVSRNYHAFFDSLFAEILTQLKAQFPQYRFAGFADHSPIAEVEAAARAGLGVIGKNHLLLTEKYSSYIFLGEIVTDATIPCEIQEMRFCENCDACTRACPASELGICLSALTQKKGTLTLDEEAAILRYGSVWGCDICQEVCPHTKRALENGTVFSKIPYFNEKTISVLNTEILDGMSESEFEARAFSWRGRDPILRNLYLFEKGDGQC